MISCLIKLPASINLSDLIYLRSDISTWILFTEIINNIIDSVQAPEYTIEEYNQHNPLPIAHWRFHEQSKRGFHFQTAARINKNLIIAFFSKAC